MGERPQVEVCSAAGHGVWSEYSIGSGAVEASLCEDFILSEQQMPLCMKICLFGVVSEYLV